MAAQRSWVHRRWVPWLAGSLAFVLTLIAGGALAADWAWRSAQMGELLDRVEASEAVMGELQDAANEAFEEHGASGDNQKLDTELRSLAAKAQEDIAAAGAAVAELPIAVWHVDIEQARDAYLLHNAAWVDYMARASQNASEFVRPQEEVNETFFDAERPFVQAVPEPDVEDLMQRVADIFAIPDDLQSDAVTA
ncbi:MAG TPA: hypothetical protein VIG24_02725 [Acidimicrobiia bacterium]